MDDGRFDTQDSLERLVSRMGDNSDALSTSGESVFRGLGKGIVARTMYNLTGVSTCPVLSCFVLSLAFSGGQVDADPNLISRVRVWKRSHRPLPRVSVYFLSDKLPTDSDLGRPTHFLARPTVRHLVAQGESCASRPLSECCTSSPVRESAPS